MIRNINRLVLLAIIAMMPMIMIKASTIALRGGGSMYYEDTGKGTPVILLHGHTLDRRMWDAQVKVLRDSFRVIVPDLRGYGLSSDPKEGFQFTYADDVVALMDSLHIERAHVIGLSMGAFVAGDMLAFYSDRIISCMMVAGEICTSFGPSTPKTAKGKAAQRQSNANSLRGGLARYKRNRIAVLMNRAGSRKEEMRESITRQIMDWRAWQVQHVTARIYYGRDAWEKFSRNPPKTPYLIVYGNLERKPRSRMLAVATQGRQVTVNDCGHMVNMEQPEEFNRIMLSWLGENQ